MEENMENLIFDVSENDFAEKIIEASDSSLILVDFWAPWCGPCKQLTPLLEEAVNLSQGKVRLAKVNIDENQGIASQLNIQSIPAVFAFKNKKITDAFQGVIPIKKIIEFIEKNLGEAIKKDFSEFHSSIMNLMENNKFDEAINLLENHLAENSNDKKSISMYIDCLSSSNMFDQANKFVESLAEENLKEDSIKSAIQKLRIKQKNLDGPSLDSLKSIYEKNPENIENILKLADSFFSNNLIDDAFDLLFKHYLSNKENIKKKLLEFFNALGNNNEKTIQYRRKLSSLIFS